MNDPKDVIPRMPAEERRAFPHPAVHPASDYAGMTVRQYLIAHAPPMPGPLRQMAEREQRKENGRDVFDMAAYAEFEAAWRKTYADAVLKVTSA